MTDWDDASLPRKVTQLQLQLIILFFSIFNSSTLSLNEGDVLTTKSHDNGVTFRGYRTPNASLPAFYAFFSTMSLSECMTTSRKFLITTPHAGCPTPRPGRPVVVVTKPRDNDIIHRLPNTIKQRDNDVIDRIPNTIKRRGGVRG